VHCPDNVEREVVNMSSGPFEPCLTIFHVTLLWCFNRRSINCYCKLSYLTVTEFGRGTEACEFSALALK